MYLIEKTVGHFNNLLVWLDVVTVVIIIFLNLMSFSVTFSMLSTSVRKLTEKNKNAIIVEVRYSGVLRQKAKSRKNVVQA